MSQQTHPGTVAFFDQEKGREWSEAAEDLPEGMRFWHGLPIVRVIYNASGNVFSTCEYGPNNQPLRHTTGFRTPPSEPKHPGTVFYIDEEKGTWWSKPAAELPTTTRFEGGIPVVTVVLTAGEEMFMHAYGANGELLRSAEGVRQRR